MPLDEEKLLILYKDYQNNIEHIRAEYGEEDGVITDGL